MDILNKIQQALKAPKSQRNNFGQYNYRSCEDILLAVKPLLGEATLVITDEIVLIGERYYVKATALLHKADGSIVASAIAYAREALNKKGMDEAQITGAASSYARKFALNGLFAIDDTKDADATSNSTGGVIECIDEKQVKEIRDLAFALKVDRALFLDFMKVGSEDQITKADFNKAIQALKAKASAK